MQKNIYTNHCNSNRYIPVMEKNRIYRETRNCCENVEVSESVSARLQPALKTVLI
jgi:hypothetical protein